MNKDTKAVIIVGMICITVILSLGIILSSKFEFSIGTKSKNDVVNEQQKEVASDTVTNDNKEESEELISKGDTIQLDLEESEEDNSGQANTESNTGNTSQQNIENKKSGYDYVTRDEVLSEIEKLRLDNNKIYLVAIQEYVDAVDVGVRDIEYTVYNGNTVYVINTYTSTDTNNISIDVEDWDMTLDEYKDGVNESIDMVAYDDNTQFVNYKWTSPDEYEEGNNEFYYTIVEKLDYMPEF